MPRGTGRHRAAACLVACLAVPIGGFAWAAGQADGGAAAHPAGDARGDARAIVDRIAVRFFAPETGGPAHPRFVTERVLAFEARLDAMTEGGGARGQTIDAQRLHNALDRHVVEEILATLDETSGGKPADEARLVREVRADLEQRAGGDGPMWIAAEEEGLGAEEVEEIVKRRAQAAAYLDRAVTRFLRPQDEQLRDVYRTSPHPFRDRPFEEIRAQLARWFVFERLKVLESTFLQTARAHVTVVLIPRSA